MKEKMMTHDDWSTKVRRRLTATLFAAMAVPAVSFAATPSEPPEHQTAAKALTTARLLVQEEDLDLKAARLLSDPAIVAASKEGADKLLASLPNATPESLARFTTAVEEITYLGVLNGINDDPSRPRITIVNRPDRILRGVFTPATKGMDENPDTIYRIIPVDGVSTYVLRGKVSLGHRPAVNEFSVLNDAWLTDGNLSDSDLKLDADGSFAITVGPEPAAGRPNYIQTKPDANYMTIRDTIADWAHQRPNQLTVERVAGPPVPPQSESVQLQKAVAKVKRYFFETLRLHDLALKQPSNFFPQPLIRTEYGMLVTQAYSIGHFEIKDGQALVLTVKPGTAKYLTVPITNIWGTTRDPIHHVSSLNSGQAAHNPDGTITFVVSRTDPGARNWVDTEGLKEGFIFVRWAAIEGGKSAADKLGIDSKVVSLDALADAVPAAALGKVDKGARAQQLAERARDNALRWAAD
jgi:hypothetical protein